MKKDSSLGARRSAAVRPKEVPECVHSLAATTFVQSVDAPTLSVVVPLLSRALGERGAAATALKRQAALIICNMSKLVDDPRDAADTYARAVALLDAREEPPPLWVSCRLGELCLSLGELALATDVYLQACRTWTTAAAAWRGAGRALLAQNEFAQAEDALAESNARNRREPATWALLALANLGQYELGDSSRVKVAAQCLEQATNLGLSCSRLLARMGVAFAAVDKLALAVDLLKRAVATEPDAAALAPPGQVRPRLELARALAKQNALIEATDQYAALLQEPDADETQLKHELAPLLAKLGKSITAD